MTSEERKRLRALAEAATHGPWDFGYGGPIKDWPQVTTPGDDREQIIVRAYDPNAEDNARFIAAASTAIPALLDEVERLGDNLTSACESFDDMLELNKDACRRIGELEAALRYIGTPRASVDMADPQEDQDRDALSALCRLQEYARSALGVTAAVEGGT